MKIAVIVVGVLLVVVAVGIGVLGTVSIPAPSGQIEKPVSLDKLQR